MTVHALAPSPMSRPRMVGVDRIEAVSAAVDCVKRLGALDPNEAVTLAAETEMAVLDVLALADQLVLFLIDIATLKSSEARLFPGAERRAVKAKIRNLDNAVDVQRKRLRQFGGKVR